jgi:hypothetical protein
VRSPISFLNNTPDWQAASLALGVGVGAPVAKGVRAAAYAIGAYGFAYEVEDLAASTVLRPFVELLWEHPEASHVKAVQYFKEIDGVREPTMGTAVLSTSGWEELRIPSDRWPSAVEPDHWDFISCEDESVFFTLARADVDAFTIGEVVCWSALAEIVLQEHKACEAGLAAQHVRAAFSEDRVSQGRAPRRWGAPGLHLIDAYLEHGGNPSAMDATGTTALAVAVYLQAADIVKKLVGAGADINAPAAGGLYPIDIAVLSGQVSMVRLCGDLGASPNTPGYLQPSLRAIDMQSLELFVELLRMGANTDAETADGLTLTDYVHQREERARPVFLAALTQFEVASAMGDVGALHASHESGTRVMTSSARKTTLSL